MKPRVVVMAKVPGEGAVKTRLAPSLSAPDRLALYEAFLRDKLAALGTLPNVILTVAVAPPGPEAMARWLGADAAARLELVAQRGAGLGERLAALAADHFATSTAPLLLVDSDTPTLPVHFFAEALHALATGRADVVLGPAADGGYTMIGLAGHEPALFEGISWSTGRVLSETLVRAAATDRRVHFLQSWHDVDTPSDLLRLGAELARLSPSATNFPAHTAAVLSRLGYGLPQSERTTHWSTLATRSVYQNRWLRVTESVVALPSGGHTLYGVVHTGPCVGVLPFVDDERVVLVRQFRYVAQRFTWEIPTGGVHEGEALEAAARRELVEETGFDADSLEPGLTMTPSKSVLDETAHLFVARGLRAASARPDETEELSTRVVSLREALSMIDAGDIVDSMSQVALLDAARRR